MSLRCRRPLGIGDCGGSYQIAEAPLVNFLSIRRTRRPFFKGSGVDMPGGERAGRRGHRAQRSADHKGSNKGSLTGFEASEGPHPSVDRADEGEVGTAYRIHPPHGPERQKGSGVSPVQPIAQPQAAIGSVSRHVSARIGEDDRQERRNALRDARSRRTKDQWASRSHEENATIIAKGGASRRAKYPWRPEEYERVSASTEARALCAAPCDRCGGERRPWLRPNDVTRTYLIRGWKCVRCKAHVTAREHEDHR